MVPGWTVFVDKGCSACHRVRGIGDGTVGPDLAGLQASTGLFDLGAAMWNHMPRMGAAMRDLGIKRPQLTPLEFSSLAAFLFTTQYYDATPGDPIKGLACSRPKAARSAMRWAAKGGARALPSTASSGPTHRSSWAPACGTTASR